MDIFPQLRVNLGFTFVRSPKSSFGVFVLDYFKPGVRTPTDTLLLFAILVFNHAVSDLGLTTFCVVIVIAATI